MVTKLKALGITALILLGFVLIGTDEPTHYCESNDLMMYCARTTAMYCYPSNETRTGSKKCSEGWKEINIEDSPKIIEKIKYNNPSGEIHCTSKGCD